MAGKRSYGDVCGIARALDRVGERWALLVVRELLLGPKRFTDLRAGLPHVATDILSQRLRELEAAGVLERATLPPPAPARVYALTARGRELEPVVLALGRWGSVAEPPPGHGPISTDAFAIALKTLFTPDGEAGEARYELRVDGQPFRAVVRGGAFTLARGEEPGPHATVEAGASTLSALLWHGASRTEARRAGTLRTAGDRAALARFWRLFPLSAGAAC